MTLWLYLFFAAILVAITVWGRTDVRGFLQSHNAIDNEGLAEFKNLGRRNMRVAVVGLVIGLLWGLTAAGLAWQFGLLGIFVVVVVSAPVILLGKSTKKLEARSRSLPCSDQQLEAEYHRVGTAWSSKLFPDF